MKAQIIIKTLYDLKEGKKTIKIQTYNNLYILNNKTRFINA